MRPMYVAVKNPHQEGGHLLISCSVGNCPKHSSKALGLNRRSIKVKLLGPYTGQDMDSSLTRKGLLLQDFTCVRCDDNTYGLMTTVGDKVIAAKGIPSLKKAQLSCILKTLEINMYEVEYVIARYGEELDEFRSYQTDIKDVE